MDVRVRRPDRGLTGELRLPTDKSISHRAVLLAAMAEGESHLIGVLDSADVRSTIDAVSALGARVETVESGPRGLQLQVTGWGAAGPTAPDGPLDCGNSGTTARLLMGILAGWPIEVTLVGDESLSRRPMKRVAEPLRLMGASIETTGQGTLPVRVHGGSLRAIDYVLPVASAQVKTAVLLAALRADGVTSVTEPAPSRDHTERMLPEFGVPVEQQELRAAVTGPAVPRGTRVIVPADASSAAFLCAASLLVPGSAIRLPNVSLNPGRIAFVEVLNRMGAGIRVSDLPPMGREPVGVLSVRQREELQAASIAGKEVPALVDEVPILALVATQATGTTRFEGVGELRVKESDRLEAVRAGLESFGATVRAGEDWLEVEGPTALQGARVSSLGDHRLALTWVVAALIAEGETCIEHIEAIDVSYPAFLHDLEGLTGGSFSSVPC